MDTNLDTKNDKTPGNTEVLMIFVGPPLSNLGPPDYESGALTNLLTMLSKNHRA